MPQISVIIPAHNEENYLRRTLHSLSQQTYQDFETIIVTNGCTDKTEEIVKKRVTDRIKHLSLSQANVSRARNYGAGKAEGELLLFLDADTSLEHDALQKIKNTFGGNVVATTRAKPDSEELKYKLALWFKNFYNTTKIYQGCSGVLICRREDFDKVNGYNPKIVVKEHRKLILDLKKLGSYTVIDTSVTTSMRRFKQWGLTKGLTFWINQWVKDKFSNLENSEYEKVR